MPTEAPEKVIATLLAPDGRPAIEIREGHPYFTKIDKTLHKSQAGPGMFASLQDEKGAFRLYASLVPVTQVKRDPINEERTIDVPMTDEQGRVLMQRDPAARTTIYLENNNDEKADSLPTTPFPNSKDAMATGLEKLGAIIVEQNKAQNDRFNALAEMLVNVLKDRK